jgi:plasmid maintenance system killer protein
MIFSCDFVVEVPWIEEYINSKQLNKQYEKAKRYVLMGNFKEIEFRKREPKSDNVYYFKINNQYRAIWYMDWSIFKVVEIDDHQ